MMKTYLWHRTPPSTNQPRRPFGGTVMTIALLTIALASCGGSNAASGSTDGFPATATFFDLDWSITSVSMVDQLDVDEGEPGEDPDPTTDHVVVDVEIANGTNDFGFSGMSHTQVLRLLSPSEPFPIEASTVLDGDGATVWRALGSSPKTTTARTWVFDVPAGTDADDLTVQLGENEDEKRTVSLAGAVQTDPTATVTLSPTAFEGDYSFNYVAFTILRSWAALDRGVDVDGSALPGGVDRRADTGEVFVNIEVEARQTSTSVVSGVNPGGHALIDETGARHACSIDAPGLYGDSTITYFASCPVPVTATNLIFELSSKHCAGGCIRVDHTVVVDTDFLKTFRAAA